MKNFTQKIYQNRYFLLFILLFAYVQSIYIRIIVRQQINAYTFTPDAALVSLIGSGVLFLIMLFFIKKWNKSETLSLKVLFKISGASLFVYLLATNTFGLLIAFLFDNIEKNFNQQTFILSLFSNFLDGLVYGVFFLAYYYYLINKKQQEKISMYNKAITESKINQLKTQLNPHFLFNNLNVLDQLIEEDKDKASDFLNEFAEIYRYVLQSTDKELVRIEDEIDFVQQYFKLIQHKYNDAYQLQIECKSIIKDFMVPLTLQLLVENAVQHNLGTKGNPVCIQIKIDENIAVSNNTNLKRNSKTVSGRGLKNLKEQYSLLSEKPIQIHQTKNYFSVEVPIIHNQNV